MVIVDVAGNRQWQDEAGIVIFTISLPVKNRICGFCRHSNKFFRVLIVAFHRTKDTIL